jgi:hypothetical protein
VVSLDAVRETRGVAVARGSVCTVAAECGAGTGFIGLPGLTESEARVEGAGLGVG